MKKIRFGEVAILTIMLLLLIEELWLSKIIKSGMDAKTGELVNMIISRVLGGLAFLILTISCKYRVMSPFKNTSGKAWLIALPALIVALNNLPFLSLLSGEASVHGAWWQLSLLLAQCMAVAFFEEMTFRSFVMLAVMEKRRASVKDIFVSIVITSGIFGLVHLVNLFTSSPVAVILQILYSFLIGAMCSVVLLYTRNIWICVLIHGLFNFMGDIVPSFGKGKIIWDHIPTIIITTIIGVLAAVFYVAVFLKFKAEDTDHIYGSDKGRVKENTVTE